MKHPLPPLIAPDTDLIREACIRLRTSDCFGHYGNWFSSSNAPGTPHTYYNLLSNSVVSSIIVSDNPRTINGWVAYYDHHYIDSGPVVGTLREAKYNLEGTIKRRLLFAKLRKGLPQKVFEADSVINYMPVGRYREWSPVDGKLLVEGHYDRHGVKHGNFRFYAGGVLLESTPFRRGKMHGPRRIFNTEGILAQINMKHGCQDGWSFRFTDDHKKQPGQIMGAANYRRRAKYVRPINKWGAIPVLSEYYQAAESFRLYEYFEGPNGSWWKVLRAAKRLGKKTAMGYFEEKYGKKEVTKVLEKLSND